MYLLADYDYELPEALIAQVPADRRDRSRLLGLDRITGDCRHGQFNDLNDLLGPSDVLVVNNTEVIPGRLLGQKETGGKAEVLLLDYADARPDPVDQSITLKCLVKASKAPRRGTRITFDEKLEAVVIDCREGVGTLKFSRNGDFESTLYRIGKIPLPPYIRRGGDGPRSDDRHAYQTVYAACKGAVAAPTAGLHFTREMLAELARKGVEIVEITLHVGYGTFSPVRVSDIRDHQIHTEQFTIPTDSADRINRARADGRRIVAVGTTSLRTLEYAADDRGMVRAGRGACDLFIYPGYRFKATEALITNFHLPKSTLLMLVSAFAGMDHIRRAYREAVDCGYRFFSYGDAMFIS